MNDELIHFSPITKIGGDYNCALMIDGDTLSLMQLCLLVTGCVRYLAVEPKVGGSTPHHAARE